jgi:hypothetical protein
VVGAASWVAPSSAASTARAVRVESACMVS